jgi:hypothetical protein
MERKHAFIPPEDELNAIMLERESKRKYDPNKSKQATPQ